METKICVKCGEKKNLQCFYKHKNSKDGLWGKCKTCAIEYSKKYNKDRADELAEYQRQHYIKNPEKRSAKDNKYYDANTQKIAAKHKEYKKKHSERYRLLNQRRKAIEKSLVADFTLEQWDFCLEYFGHADAYTGLAMDNLSQDHVIPVSKGGNYTSENIIPCKRGVNSSKGNKDMLTWFRKQPYYDVGRENKILDYIAMQARNKSPLLPGGL